MNDVLALFFVTGAILVTVGFLGLWFEMKAEFKSIKRKLTRIEYANENTRNSLRRMEKVNGNRVERVVISYDGEVRDDYQIGGF